jgi:disulfide bond formation protein DsbB
MGGAMRAFDPVLRRWPIVALVLSAATLAIAHSFQTFGHLAPCHLCLKQREVYWAAMAISAVAVVAGQTPMRGAATRIGCAILALTFGYGAYLAGFHAGAEWHWWKAPVTCASNGPVNLSALKALLAGGGARQPACDQAPWVFLGLSMAGWNFVASVGLAVASLLAALRKGDPA